MIPVVLFSSGLDSAVLLADGVSRYGGAQPVYVSVGFAWEAEERVVAERFLDAMRARGGIAPLAQLSVDMRDVYPPTHWAVRGQAPGFDTPDSDVYLEGRNVILLSKAAVFAARAALTTILIGPLAGNPFPDARPMFFETMARALSLGLDAEIRIDAPLLTLQKEDVIRRGVQLNVPFELTLSCMQPVGGMHCGRCSKCRERRDAFRAAGIEDPAPYATPPMR
ncbi:MAG TPA: 7-cyano-7-deazaguanine synthase [Vicinamibacterales bacterium]|jgi:7-cyano-7-deazaguanine synthase|nr:7-cyano-7-deazaguanine synthase [Vicinamibacterales bacterium]